MQDSKIEWTDTTWNPVRGCTKISPGCTHCYAETFAERWRGVPGHPYEQGFDLRLVPEKLTDPLKWKKPRRVFVNSMSDLFHKDVPFDFIDLVFGVMGICPQHTFQVLTKRPERMAEYCNRPDAAKTLLKAQRAMAKGLGMERMSDAGVALWPLPNVWLGTSVENQKYADERIPHLLNCPAAVLFLSCEPLLGPVRLDQCAPYTLNGDESNPGVMNAFNSLCHHPLTAMLRPESAGNADGISWVIVGGESGHGARPMQVDWVRSIVRQCKAANVACFVKQLGADPKFNRDDTTLYIRNKKGGDISEWPADLRVREFPTQKVSE